MRPSGSVEAEPRQDGHRRLALVLGIAFIAAGLIFNEWLLAPLFSPSGEGGGRIARKIRNVDIALILWGIAVLRFRSRLLIKLSVSIVSLASCLLLVELALRAAPEILGRDFANGVRTLYSTTVKGIYYTGEDCDGRPINLMKPSFSADMYYNGYTWDHLTDSHGFRNPVERSRAEAVLIGDSMVYGHGLEIEDTLAVQLEQVSGLTVTNLGLQGSCALSGSFYLGQNIDRLEPDYVFYFFFENDVFDVYWYLDDAAIESYLAKPLAASDDCELDNRWRPGEAPHTLTSRLRRFIGTPYLVRIGHWRQAVEKQRATQRRAKGVLRDGRSAGWEVTRAAILRMRNLARSRGAEFIIVPITPASRKADKLLGNFARQHGIPLIDTSEIHEDNEALFLPGDGHLSGEGTRRLAGLIAAWLEAQKVAEASRLGP